MAKKKMPTMGEVVDARARGSLHEWLALPETKALCASAGADVDARHPIAYGFMCGTISGMRMGADLVEDMRAELVGRILAHSTKNKTMSSKE